LALAAGQQQQQQQVGGATPSELAEVLFSTTAKVFSAVVTLHFLVMQIVFSFA